MTNFCDELRRLMRDADLSLRELARRTHYDPGYLSKVANGHKPASQKLAKRLDTALGAGGRLTRLAPDEKAVACGTWEALEILRRLEASDAGPATLEALRMATDRLCRNYPFTPAPELHRQGREELRHVLRLLDGRTTLTQHRELLVIAGWLTLLTGCVEYDMGQREIAETTRVTALHLGREAGHTEIIAWSHEMAAWFALTQGNYRTAVEHARAGRDVAGKHSAAIQLTAQEAKGWARLGERKELETALEWGRTLLDQLPRPQHPEHHFMVDPDKYDFYAMDCYRLCGQDTKARVHALEVIRLGTAPDGTERSPMRMAEARITLGVVAARGGDLEQAVTEGLRAFASQRRSLPSLLMAATELDTVFMRRYPRERMARQFQEQLRTLRQSIATLGQRPRPLV